MAKRLTAKEKARRKAQRKRERLTKEYNRLLSQTKNVFHDASVGFYGISFEKFVKSLGTSTGLKRPTEKSIKALKKAQSQEQVLKVARRLVLMQRYTSEQTEKLKEINKRIGEQENLNKDSGNSIINELKRNIKNFIIQLDNVINRLSKIAAISRDLQEALSNGRALKTKILENMQNSIENLTQSGEDLEPSFEVLQELSDNCVSWCNDFNTVEPRQLYGPVYQATYCGMRVLPNSEYFNFI